MRIIAFLQNLIDVLTRIHSYKHHPSEDDYSLTLPQAVTAPHAQTSDRNKNKQLQKAKKVTKLI